MTDDPPGAVAPEREPQYPADDLATVAQLILRGIYATDQLTPNIRCICRHYLELRAACVRLREERDALIAAVLTHVPAEYRHLWTPDIVALLARAHADESQWMDDHEDDGRTLQRLEAAVAQIAQKMPELQSAAEALRIVDFDEHQQRFFCRACRYRDPLGPDGNKLHDDNCRWVHYVQTFKNVLDQLATLAARKGTA